MYTSFRKDMKKIQNKLDTICRKGKDNYVEYNEYIDHLIKGENYAIFTELLVTKYDINPKIYKSVDDLKNGTWSRILFKTKTKIQEDIYKLYNDSNIYQIGNRIYSNENLYLGSVDEMDVYINSIDNFSYTSSEYQKIIDNKILSITVIKSDNNNKIIKDWDFDKPYDKNVLDLYKNVITFLKS